MRTTSSGKELVYNREAQDLKVGDIIPAPYVPDLRVGVTGISVNEIASSVHVAASPSTYEFDKLDRDEDEDMIDTYTTYEHTNFRLVFQVGETVPVLNVSVVPNTERNLCTTPVTENEDKNEVALVNVEDKLATEDKSDNDIHLTYYDMYYLDNNQAIISTEIYCCESSGTYYVYMQGHLTEVIHAGYYTPVGGEKKRLFRIK